jgi:hypothetical protein
MFPIRAAGDDRAQKDNPGLLKSRGSCKASAYAVATPLNKPTTSLYQTRGPSNLFPAPRAAPCLPFAPSSPLFAGLAPFGYPHSIARLFTRDSLGERFSAPPTITARHLLK